MISPLTSEDHSSGRVQYALKFVNEMLAAASEKAVAIPGDNKTVNQCNIVLFLSPSLVLMISNGS